MADAHAQDPFGPERRKGIDRRTFVKRTVGTAAVGAVGAAGLGLAFPLSTTAGLKIPRFPYFGAKIIGGPAPKGIPIIPIKVAEDGTITGVPSHLDWYKYCSHDEAPGLEGGFTNDNRLFYFQNQEKIHRAETDGIHLWYKDLLDQPLRVNHFDEDGKGAPFKWRSEGQFDNNIITGIAIRLNPEQIENVEAAEELMGAPFMDQGIVAFCSFCAHFCCVPGYKEAKDAEARDAWETIFCTCHGSIYDPFVLEEYQFPPNG